MSKYIIIFTVSLVLIISGASYFYFTKGGYKNKSSAPKVEVLEAGQYGGNNFPSKESQTASSGIVGITKSCENEGLFEITSTSTAYAYGNDPKVYTYITLTQQTCKNSKEVSYSVSPWNITTQNGIKKYGIVIGGGYKCNCHDDIGYFDYKDTQQVGGKLMIASTSIITYQSLSKDFSPGVSIHYFNELPYLLIMTSTSLFSFDPSTKVATKLLTLNQGEDFSGPDLPADTIELVDAHHIKYTVFSSSNKPDSYLGDIVQIKELLIP